VQTTDQVAQSSPSQGPKREPQATLPDGVPSMLWDESVESERYLELLTDATRDTPPTSAQ
jgi:hypothetical protein